MDVVNMTIEEMEFGGILLSVVEDQFCASLGGSDGEDFRSTLYSEFVRCGRPKNVKKWLKERLIDQFKCISEKPRWMNVPQWPWCDGEPMIFIAQYDQKNQFEDELGNGYSIYVFARKTNVSVLGHDAWKPCVRTVVQAKLYGSRGDVCNLG